MAIEPIIKGHLFVAVDFDGTITDCHFDNFGKYTLRPNCKEVIERLHKTGKVHFCIWSCRCESQLKTAKAFLKEEGLYEYFEHFNEDFDELVELYGEATRKLSADVYIDDRTFLFEEVDWLKIEEGIMNILNRMDSDIDA